MSAHVRTAAAVLIMTGVLAGCSSTTTGTVAQTTEPGPPLTTSRSPSSSRPTPTGMPTIPNIPGLPIPAPRTPTVPAPANWQTMTCKEYTSADDATQIAVIDAIVSQPKSVFTKDMSSLAKSLADAMCTLVPSASVSDVVMGGGLPK
jgi:hypothetical protein